MRLFPISLLGAAFGLAHVASVSAGPILRGGQVPDIHFSHYGIAATASHTSVLHTPLTGSLAGFSTHTHTHGHAFSTVAVPEPANLALFAAGLLGLGLARRQVRKAARGAR